jgi:5-methylcytosine-specific restriction endonuclease McrA
MIENSTQLPAGYRRCLVGPGPQADEIARMTAEDYANALTMAADLWPQVEEAKTQADLWAAQLWRVMQQHDYQLSLALGYEKRLAHEARLARRTNTVEGRARETRKRRRAASDGHYSPAQWQALCALCGYRCLACGRAEPEITLVADHVRPLSDASEPPDDTIANIQPLCLECNTRKGTQTIDYRPQPNGV